MSFAISRRLLTYKFGEIKTCFHHYAKRTTSTSSKLNQPKLSNVKRVAAGVALGVLAGGGYSYYQNDSSNFIDVQPVRYNNRVKTFPKVEISRHIVVPHDTTGLKLTLFQYPTCPFCCKVRAFLDYYGISYDVVEVNPVLRQQIKWSQYKKVPILLAKTENGYLQYNDSSMIISGLATHLKDQVGLENIQELYPVIRDSDDPKKLDIMNKYFVMNGSTNENDLKKDKEERKWRMWADNVLVHMLSPNVYRTKEEALEAFKWFSEVGEWDKLFSSWERLLVIYVGAFAMLLIGKKLKSKYNLQDDVRQSLYEKCNEWMKEIEKKGTEYLGGHSPNLADLAVYGVLCSIEGCQAFKELLENTNIGTWYFRMKQVVQNHQGQAVLN